MGYRDINCYHCKKSISYEVVSKFDEKGNMLCVHCDKIIFAMDEDSYGEMVKTAKFTNETSYYTVSGNKKEILPIRMELMTCNEVDCKGSQTSSTTSAGNFANRTMTSISKEEEFGIYGMV